MSDISKEDYEALAQFRYRLRRFLHFTEEGARSEGLTPQQHQALLSIKGQLGRDWATISDVAEALQLKHHTAVELLDRCSAAGLVSRAQSSEDRRQVRVALTPAGESVLARLSENNLKELQMLRAAINAPALDEKDGEKIKGQT